jgi:hypothetical protein
MADIKHYHQSRMLPALAKKIWEAHPHLSEADAANRARTRMKRMGSGSRDLFDLDVNEMSTMNRPSPPI